MTQVMSFTRFTREANAPNAGTRKRSRTAWTADGVGLPRRARLGQDERLAHRLEDVVAELQEEEVQGQEERHPRLPRPHLGHEAEGLLEGRPRLRQRRGGCAHLVTSVSCETDVSPQNVNPPPTWKMSSSLLWAM